MDYGELGDGLPVAKTATPYPYGWSTPKRLDLPRELDRLESMVIACGIMMSVLTGILVGFVMRASNTAGHLGHSILAWGAGAVVFIGGALLVDYLAISGPVHERALSAIRTRRFPIQNRKLIGNIVAFDLVIEDADGNRTCLPMRREIKDITWAQGASWETDEPLTAQFPRFDYDNSRKGDDKRVWGTGVILALPHD